MIKILLYPLSWLYGTVVYIRNRMYDLNLLKSTEFDVPVISIGNITVGGTGKTPHVEYLVQLLKDKFEVATLSRGYKRKTTGYLEIQPGSTSEEAGDEPLQIKNHFPEITVSVCEKRVEGVEKLLRAENEKLPDVVILDDAFQHRRITPGINILLIDYNRPVKEDHLLPLGRLREGVSQMRRANIIVFTKCPDEVTPIMRRILQKDVGLLPYQSLFFSTLEYGKLKPVFSAKRLDKTFYTDKTHSILIVTGIASPKLFHDYMKKFSSHTKILSFPDHHYYSEADIQQIEQNLESLPGINKIIVTTEKDSMRLKDKENLPETIKNSLYLLPAKVNFPDAESREFNKKILNYVGENKSNRELHNRKNKSKT
ncbi:MAG: tetraacyldisaccharide 4'-kinase [Draconibacterium sp.]